MTQHQRSAHSPVSPPKQPQPAACRGIVRGGGGDVSVMPTTDEVFERDFPQSDATRGRPAADDEPEEAEQEVQEAKSGSVPSKPSSSEVERHRIAHFPYRNWCPECVMGQAIGRAHKTEKNASKIPIIGMDYFYINDKGELLTGQEAEGNGPELDDGADQRTLVKCLVLYDRYTKALFAFAVPQKGVDDERWIVKQVVEIVEWLGHSRIILKSDNERALVTLVRQALKDLRVQDVSGSSEHSADYDSQANGGTETAVRMIRGPFRSMRLDLEKRIGWKIPIHHATMTWLLNHVANLRNVLGVGDDGVTGWTRARGRPFNMPLYHFCESVMFKLPSKGPMSNPRGNMGSQWSSGIYLGFCRNSNEHILGTTEGVKYARAIQRRPYEEQWKTEPVAELRATPYSMREKHEPGVVFDEPVDRHPPPEEKPVPMPRNFRVARKDVQNPTIGFTVNCPRCEHIRAYGEGKPGQTHTATCRARVMVELGKTVEGQVRLDAAEQRVDRALGEFLDRHAPSETHAQASSSQQAAVPRAEQVNEEEMEQSQSAPRGDSMEDTNEQIERDEPMDADHLEYAPTGAGMRTEKSIYGIVNKTEPWSRLANRPETPKPCNAYDDYGQEACNLLSIGPELDEGMLGEDMCVLLMSQYIGSKDYRRERRQGASRMVSEVFSPPRVTKALSRFPGAQLLPGFALDLTCNDVDDNQPWDFDRKDKREKARMMLREQRPLFLIGSPDCTAFSSWQALNALRRDPGTIHREYVRARLHLDFCCQLYAEQVEGGRYFIHEHPETATSWREPCVQRIIDIECVGVSVAHMCQYGLQAQGEPLKKPTKFISNSACVLAKLQRRCTGVGGMCSHKPGQRHRHCEGKIARDAQEYIQSLCHAMIRGMHDQLIKDGIAEVGMVGLHAAAEEALEEVGKSPADGFSGKYTDDLTGQVLNDTLVREARAKELDYFKAKGVWQKILRSDTRKFTSRRPVTVRWVDVNKGDDLHPNYRCRLVARQLKAHDRSGENFFAPTPPLEALRTVFSLTTSTIGEHKPCRDPSSEQRVQLSFVDVSRAYFNARVDPDDVTMVELPEEDPDSGTHVARLLRHMYGTRRAADGWQEEYSSTLVEMGFVQGLSSPCVFRHAGRGLACSVHGDDFTTSGPKSSLDWFEDQIGQRYEVTIGPRMGPGPHDGKEARVLNRVVRWTEQGLEMEADPRQTEKLLEECGLTGANAVCSPGVRATAAQITDDKPLSAQHMTAFRAAAARANYLAADRLDCQFAAKEVCRWMSTPTLLAWEALRRLCRYLAGLPRLVYRYPWQTVDAVDTYSDTDWAGCPKTRKSTSGGCVMLGCHVIKHWSSTQPSVSLSSGEAEFYGVVRGAGMGLGYQSLLRDLGHDVPLRLWTDSSAAIGICTRQGLGKLRHLDTHTLWVQHAVRARRVDLRKVDGTANPADIFIKHFCSGDKLKGLVNLFGGLFLEGRADSAPQVKKGAGSKVTIGEAMNDEEDINNFDDSTVLPHLTYDATTLALKHPPMTVPDEDESDLQQQDDHRDGILQSGLKQAKAIVAAAAAHGRKRFLPSGAATTGAVTEPSGTEGAVTWNASMPQSLVVPELHCSM